MKEPLRLQCYYCDCCKEYDDQWYYCELNYKGHPLDLDAIISYAKDHYINPGDKMCATGVKKIIEKQEKKNMGTNFNTTCHSCGSATDYIVNTREAVMSLMTIIEELEKTKVEKARLEDEYKSYEYLRRALVQLEEKYPSLAKDLKKEIDDIRAEELEFPFAF